MKAVEQAAAFLKEAGTFFVATAEGDQPRVRPFGALNLFEDKLYLITNNQKDCYKQILADPKVEVCACIGPKWIRIAGKLIADDRREARQAMLEANPGLTGMYSADDGRMVVLYFEDAKAVISSFTEAPVTLEF